MLFQMILEMSFLKYQWLLDSKSILNLSGWENIINLLACQMAVKMLWKFLQKFLKPVLSVLTLISTGGSRNAHVVYFAL